VIVPALPGALSALGILVSDVVKDYSRTVLWPVTGKLPAAQLDREFAALQKQATKDFHQEAWEGRVHYRAGVDIRYRGQGFELTLPFTKNLLKEFQQEHQRRYGYAHPAREVELVTLRLRALVKPPRLKATKGHVGTAALGRSSRAKFGAPCTIQAPVFFDGKKLHTAIYLREALQPGKKYSGPAIITEYSATTVIPADKRFHLDPAANLIVTIR
jgi:N-methylhydantoinase A